MNKLVSGVAAALLASALLAAPAAAAAAVTVRVEGASTTLVPLTRVTTAPGQIVKDGSSAHSCSAEHAIGALELATGGDWSGPWFNGLGYSVETVRGETHNAGTNEFYAFWIDGKMAQQGVCDQTLADGDELLFYPDCFGGGCTSPPPLDLAAPATAQRGAPFDVRVVTLDGNGGSAPAQGATVTAGGATATAVTGADGTAVLIARGHGRQTLRAARRGLVPAFPEPVIVG